MLFPEKITSVYTVSAIIGKGGMGDVYLAEHKVLKRKVAIKALHFELFHNEQFRARFIHEALVMAKLQHPGIVSLYEYVEDETAVFLIIEYAEGLALDDYIAMKEGKMPENEAVDIMVKILEAMQYAHDQGVIHRDIKPSNIIYNPEKNTIKILDFGIAKLSQEANKQLTKTGTQMGTIYYMSPEQVKGETLDHRSDIYSLGVVFYQMLSGKNPYEHLTSEYSIYDEIVRNPLPEIKHLDIKIQELINIFKKATHKQINKRFSDCGSFKKAILESEKLIDLTENKVKELHELNLIEDNPTNYGKTTLFLLIIAILAFIFWNYKDKIPLIASDQQKAENNCKLFLNYWNNNEFEKASKLGTQNTKSLISLYELFGGEHKKFPVNEVFCVINESRISAKCIYCCDDKEKNDSLNMLKIDSEWLVDIKKED
jgi:serine/threonine protein kinase